MWPAAGTCSRAFTARHAAGPGSQASAGRPAAGTCPQANSRQPAACSFSQASTNGRQPAACSNSKASTCRRWCCRCHMYRRGCRPSARARPLAAGCPWQARRRCRGDWGTCHLHRLSASCCCASACSSNGRGWFCSSGGSGTGRCRACSSSSGRCPAWDCTGWGRGACRGRTGARGSRKGSEARGSRGASEARGGGRQGGRGGSSRGCGSCRRSGGQGGGHVAQVLAGGAQAVCRDNLSGGTCPHRHGDEEGHAAPVPGPPGLRCPEGELAWASSQGGGWWQGPGVRQAWGARAGSARWDVAERRGHQRRAPVLAWQLPAGLWLGLTGMCSPAGGGDAAGAEW